MCGNTVRDYACLSDVRAFGHAAQRLKMAMHIVLLSTALSVLDVRQSQPV